MGNDTISELHIGWFWRSLRRHWILFLCVFLTTLLLVGGALWTLPKVYTGRAIVAVDPRARNTVDIKAVVEGVLGDPAAVSTELEMIRSRDAIRSIAREFRLDRRAEFNDALNDAVDGDGTDASSRLQHARVIDNVARRVSTMTLNASRAIEVSFRSEDPQLAADVANRLVDLYLEAKAAGPVNATSRAALWLDARLDELKERVRRSEGKVEQFRVSSILREGRDPDIIDQQIADWSRQLVTAQAGWQQRSAQLKSAEDAEATRGARGVLALARLPVGERLTIDEASLVRRAAEIGVNSGPNHPRMAEIQEGVKKLQTQMEREARSWVASLRLQQDEAARQVTTIQESLERLQAEKAAMNKAEITLRELEREAAADRSVLEVFLQRSREAREIAPQEPYAEVIARADFPAKASSPNLPVLGGGGILLALLAGGAATLGAEARTRRRYYSIDQLRTDLGLPIHATIPVWDARRHPERLGLARSGRDVAGYASAHPESSVGVAARSLVAGTISWINRNDLSDPVVFTSALPGEGKTTLAVSTALILARSGRRVLLIDADLRRPRVHQVLGETNERGLAQFLTPEEEIAAPDIRHPTSHERLDIVTAGVLPDRTTIEPLHLARLSSFVDTMRREYDVIIIDAPPVLPVPDALLLAGVFKHTVMVVAWNRTARRVVRHAVDQLLEGGAKLSGVAFNKVDQKKLARFDCTESQYLSDRSYRDYLRT
ncbi:polysaccharide biosynthesis tyrosine autokinase [Azospirillum formosense]|uniref:non-specific protein-tyrosine kinase n=1 Tax=Azospirillum formosense TaxID=861533 RepID=A0ABX2KWS5_9PROT|nr:polysaccharide biosynthesis tyrosine autokinase [Azospirillum formosense]MBY3756425.1 polysaccharide biosynthesis tyrosine autokinase [Azospirillum formosense]NUB19007.1 polysaccharide biosynthesis tyrosine autokinase [Azospirillum formosense]